ncbi:MAG: hypothetical protein WCF85_10320 [Rhodospirillaceae bacterium]
MKLERMVLGTGAVFGLFVLVAAVFSDDVGDHPDFDVSGKVIAEAIGAGAGVGTPGLNAPQMPQDMPVGGLMQPAAMAGANFPGLVPFARPTQERFAGRITQVTPLGADTGWGQVHITIVDAATGTTRIVSLAPTWFLEYQGCTVMQNYPVSGMAFSFGGASSAENPLYARVIKVNGRPCQLRSDEGFALWTSRAAGPRP